MKKEYITAIFIILIITLSVLIDIPKGPNIKIGNWQKEIKLHLGLDLQGGTHLVYQLDTSKIDSKDITDAVNSAVDIIDRRVNALGVSEPVVQSAKIGESNNIIVELPGIKNINEATNLIGKTAQLTFWEMDANSENLNLENELDSSWKETGLNGSHLKKAEVKFDQNTGSPYISLTFNDNGKQLFSEITKRNLGKPVAIVLDNEIISAPTVQSVIETGDAMISGKFSIAESKNLTKLLNAGALPVPIDLVEQRNIGATLGIESVKSSLIAGLIGIALVIIFMIIYYKFLGLISSIALIIYGLILLALFKIIPITLTLPGIAGFIISFGMAVDANVLIFSRMQEESRKELPASAVVENGFKRALSSIIDSNVSTIITCIILYIFTSSLVKGFALTLGIGVVVSMFSAITITKNLLKLCINTKFEKYLKI